MTTKEVEKKLQEGAAQLKKHVDERKDDILAKVFEQIEKEKSKTK